MPAPERLGGRPTARPVDAGGTYDIEMTDGGIPALA
jgi:hypothetical protein